MKLRLSHILILMCLLACTSEVSERTDTRMGNSLDVGIQGDSNNHSHLEVNDEYGRRVYKDSLHFSIVRRWFDNENLFIEYITDTNTNLVVESEYYENGKLKEIGTLTYPSHIPIGEWRYYSESGNLDSIVDYDEKYPISYWEALEIAGSNGISGNYVQVSLKEDGDTKWLVRYLHGPKKNHGVTINVQTGQVDSVYVVTVTDVSHGLVSPWPDRGIFP